MRSFRKAIGLLLCLLFLFAAAACNVNGGQAGGNTQQGEVTEDVPLHRVEGTLHKVTVTETDRPFVTAGSSEYVVVAGESNAARTAANFIVTHILGATGAELPLRVDAEWSAEAKYIVVGNSELFAAVGLTMPEDDIGFSGYYIKSVGDSVFLAVNGDDGYQLAAIAFLRHVVGYDMLSEDTVLYEKDGATLPDMEVVERPDYDYRQESEPVGNGRYGMGYSSGFMMSVNGIAWHNSFQYLPPEKWAKTYPEWYTVSGRTQSSSTGGHNPGQLCYTAHGNEKGTYSLMIDTAFAKLKETVDANPGASFITFTQEDNYEACDCEYCEAEAEKYGGSANGPVIKFVNALAEKLEEYLGDSRRVTISFFAYRATEKSPTVQNADGSYAAIDGIHCHPNVGVVIAPITATYSHSFYESQNQSFAENIRSWSAVCDNVYMWLYQTNFAHYMFPANTWDTAAESYRFCKENNAVYMYNEGQWNTNAVSHFSKLKEYVDSRLLVDVNLNYGSLVDRFFANYYGEGGAAMRTYFDALQAHMKYLEAAFSDSVRGGYKDNIAQAQYWPKRLLEGWTELVTEAFAAIEPLREADSARYQTYYDHILLESLFPRYALLSLYSGTYSSSELQQMRTSFKEDSSALGATKVNEETDFSSVFNTWGI